MRFYLDQDLSQRIAEIARRWGLDVLSSHECGMNGTADDIQLAYATDRRRCIVTNNYGDFLDLTEEYDQQGREHSGILLLSASLRPNDFAAVARALLHYSHLYPVDVISHTDWLHPAP